MAERAFGDVWFEQGRPFTRGRVCGIPTENLQTGEVEAPPAVSVDLLIDTGATCSGITEEVAEEIGAMLHSPADVSVSGGGGFTSLRYTGVSIVLAARVSDGALHEVSVDLGEAHTVGNGRSCHLGGREFRQLGLCLVVDYAKELVEFRLPH